MKAAALLLFAAVCVVLVTPANETNAPAAVFNVSTNNEVTWNGKVIGRIDGTNYAPVPNLEALTASYNDGFALGVRYGAVATRRNPDVSDWNALITIARAILQADQQRQPQKPGK